MESSETPSDGQEWRDRAYLETLAAEEATDRKRLKWALGAAVILHAILFLVRLPELTRPLELTRAGGQPAVYVVQQVRFRPPRQVPQRAIPQRKRLKRRIPVPDPTPDDPEPIRDLEAKIPTPDLDLPVGETSSFTIPDGPPGVGEALGALEVGGDVQAPVKVYAPNPRYTEEARQARIQGFVILQAVIDREGKVASIEVLKGLPNGLDKSAVDTVKQWTFRPATKNGEPVAVYYDLTVSFSLQ